RGGALVPVRTAPPQLPLEPFGDFLEPLPRRQANVVHRETRCVHWVAPGASRPGLAVHGDTAQCHPGRQDDADDCFPSSLQCHSLPPSRESTTPTGSYPAPGRPSRNFMQVLAARASNLPSASLTSHST